MSVVPRRRFLNQLAAGGLTAAGMCSNGRGQTAPNPPKALPAIQLAGRPISRMLSGGNPIGGFSHNTARMGALMSQYFTLERTIADLAHCWEEGVNAVSSGYSRKMDDALRAVRVRGCNMQWVVTAANRPIDEWDKIVALKPVPPATTATSPTTPSARARSS